MATNFPTSKDDNTTLPSPTGSSTLNNPDHAAQHANVNDATKAIQTKLGTGSSAPATGTLLIGTGAGTSAWSQMTSAQLAAVLSDETGSGANVFANTPTLITPKVDTINEATAANGVTIDGLSIKDGALNTSNSVVTSNITDAAVTVPKMNNSGSWNSSWVWQSWTPTWTNATVGNGTVTAKYARVGKFIAIKMFFTLGSTSVISTDPYFTLPVSASSDYTAFKALGIGTGTYYDASGTGFYPLSLVVNPFVGGSASTAAPYALAAGSTYLGYSGLSAAIPLAYGTSDGIFLTGLYEEA